MRSAIKQITNITNKRLYTTSNRPIIAVFGTDIDNPLSFHVIKQLLPHAHVRVQAQSADKIKSQFEKKDINVSSVEIIEGNSLNEFSVESTIYGADIVINVDQLLIEAERSYLETYVHGVCNIGTISDRYNVKTFIQTSVLGADLDHESRFLDINYRAEDMAYGSFPNVTIVRPNFATFGDRKSTIELFRSRLPLKLSPVIPYPSMAKKLKVQPVHINDVASAITKVALEQHMPGRIIELCGANTYLFTDFLRKVFGTRGFLPVPNGIIHGIYGVTQFLPGAVISRDQVPIICSSSLEDKGTGVYDLTELANLPIDPMQRKRLATFKDLGIEPIGF